MIPDECCSTCRHPLVQVSENGRKFTVSNRSKKPFVKIRYDGCVLKSAMAADYVLRTPSGDLIIELKGTNVDHGSKQVLATAEHFRSSQKNSGPFAAMIVATQFPKINTVVQRAKLAFAKEFKGPLHVVNKNYTFDLDRVFDFKGPL